HRQRRQSVRRRWQADERHDPRLRHQVPDRVRAVDRAQQGALALIRAPAPRPTMSSPFPADLVRDVAKRRTFAIISHPDAGKTTLTEKLLLFGGAIQMAGTVKARKSARHATSDWMEVEKQRGISVTSSVMQFEYDGHTINLLDTPGHQ